MSDVQQLLSRIEALQDGLPLAGDDEPMAGLGTRGQHRKNTANLRTGSLAVYAGLQPISSRMACELCDNVETIKAALRFWIERQKLATHPTPEKPS